MTPEEIRWLTYGAILHRPHGAPRWDDAGTAALITKHCGSWSLDIATVHVLAHARDPKAKTPGVIVGNAPSSTEPQRSPRYPPKGSDECANHPGEWATSCRICNAPKVVDEQPEDRSTRTERTSNYTEHVAALKALAMQQAADASHAIGIRKRAGVLIRLDPKNLLGEWAR